MDGIAPIYRFIVAHLSPGLLALWPLYLSSSPVSRLVDSVLSSNGTVGQGLALIGIALVVGLLIDGLCFITLDYVVAIIRKSLFKQQTAKRSPQTAEDFDFIDRIYAMNHSWKQLYTSSALIFLCTAILKVTCYDDCSRLDSIWLVILSISFLVAAARSATNYESLLASKWGVE